MTQKEKAEAYDKAIALAKNILDSTDDNYVCTYLTKEDIKRMYSRFFPELTESEDERIRKEIYWFLTQPDTVCDKRWIAWLEKQKVLTTEENLQGKEDVLWCIKQAKKHAKDENEMGTCWFAEKWLEKQGEQKSANNDKHEYEEIINGIIDFVICPNLLLPNRKQEYITFLEDMKENGRRIHFSKKVKSEKQVVLITESNGNAYIDWDTRSLEDARKLLECGLQYINTELEKQGEQKPADKVEPKDYNSIDPHFGKPIDNVEPKFKIGDVVCDKSCTTLNKEAQHNFEITDIRDGMYICDEWSIPVSQQDEFELATKFHKDEWITNGDYTWKIVEVKPLDYTLQSQDGDIVDDTISHVDEHFHSFTIEDAKDGDVLVCDINKGEIGGDIEKLPNITPTIFIYQKVVKDHDFIHSYCSLYDGSSLVFRTMYYNTFVYNIHPATKSQRDILFTKMREAGCEWDAEKKELKKIEQEPIDCNEEYYNEELKSALFTSLRDAREQYLREKNAAWSEEDENGLNDALGAIKQARTIAKDENDMGNLWYAENWLKSLKDRVGCKANCTTTWKPSEEQLNTLFIYAEQNTKDGYILTSLYKDLKKL